jgi:hypothetical protein
VGVGDWGIDLGIEAEAGAYLAQVEYGLDTAHVDLAAELYVGGEAAVDANVDLDPLDGLLMMDAGFDVFVGVAAGGETRFGSDAAAVTAGGEIGIGFGASGEIDLGLDGGVFRFDMGASGFLGVGGGFDVRVEVDLVDLGTGALDVLEDATGWLSPWW